MTDESHYALVLEFTIAPDQLWLEAALDGCRIARRLGRTSVRILG